MASVAATSPRVLSELERQQYYMSQLPENYDFPLFSGKQAVESQRRSGYKDTARAAREIVDTTHEAGAKNVWVSFDRPRESERGKHEPRNVVSAMAFIDDGPGMRPPMARYALSWGGGTHFEEPTGIGKFGFGLPRASGFTSGPARIPLGREPGANYDRRPPVEYIDAPGEETAAALCGG